MTKIAKKVGLDGIVCSAHEIKLVKNIAKDIEIFVPGIRLKKELDDIKDILQKVIEKQEKIEKSGEVVYGEPHHIGRKERQVNISLRRNKNVSNNNL